MNSVVKKYWLEALVHLLFWSAVTYMLGSMSTVSISQRSQNMAIDISTVVSFFPLCLITVGFLMLLFYGNVYWLFKKILHNKSDVIAVLLIALWLAVNYISNYFVVGYLWHLHFIEAINPSSIVKANQNWNDWNHRQLVIFSDFVFVFGLSVAYYFVKAWVKNEIIKKQLEAHQLSTELNFLKSQINPHFLFNTLNNLFSMAQGRGNEELANCISRLSGMMRYMLYESNTSRVPLSKEISYLEDTIILNKLRYAAEEINVTFNYPQQADGLAIAPMIFTPFVENAFKHGVLIGQQSSIDISILVEDDVLIFSCLNNNYSFVKKMADAHSGIGLQNIKRRLQLIYNDKYDLSIQNDINRFAVTLKINLA